MLNIVYTERLRFRGPEQGPISAPLLLEALHDDQASEHEPYMDRHAQVVMPNGHQQLA